MKDDADFQSSSMFPDIFARIRPLGAVSAVVLVVAAGVSLSRPEMRSSGLGQALSTHALCLAVACLLQTVAYLNAPQWNTSCFPYAYSAYFFRVAANVWLTAITFNRYRKFRQPLGVLALTARETGRKYAWKRYVFMSFFAWGVSTVLTAFTVSMHWNRGNIPPSVVLPRFIETRTCLAYFTMINISEANIHDSRASDLIGSLCYYYIPMVLLVITNGVLAAKTVFRVRILHRGTAGIDQEANSSCHRIESQTYFSCIRRRDFELSWFYTKILLTTGLIELILEITILFSVDGYTPKLPLTLQEEENVGLFLFPLLMPIQDFFRAMSVLWVCVNHKWWSISEWMWGKDLFNKTNICPLMK